MDSSFTPRPDQFVLPERQRKTMKACMLLLRSSWRCETLLQTCDLWHFDAAAAGWKTGSFLWETVPEVSEAVIRRKRMHHSVKCKEEDLIAAFDLCLFPNDPDEGQ